MGFSPAGVSFLSPFFSFSIFPNNIFSLSNTSDINPQMSEDGDEPRSRRGETRCLLSFAHPHGCGTIINSSLKIVGCSARFPRRRGGEREGEGEREREEKRGEANVGNVGRATMGAACGKSNLLFGSELSAAASSAW